MLTTQISFLQSKEEENKHLKEKMYIFEKEISLQQTKKIDEGIQIINDLNSCISEINENFSSPNGKKHYDFVLNFQILKILALLHLKSVDCMQESFDVFSIFSSKSIFFEKLKQINFEKNLQRKIFTELSSSLPIIAGGKSEMFKKASKRTKDFNKLLIKFLQTQKEKFFLSISENNEIQKISNLHHKISFNEIAINYAKTIEKKEEKVIKKKSEKKENEKKNSFKKNKEDSFEKLLTYEKKMRKRMEKINELLKNLTYDSLLFAIKIVYLGPFDLNYQKSVIKTIFETFLEEETVNISPFWLDKNVDSQAKELKFLLEICDIYVGNYKFYNVLPLSLIYELNFLLEVLKIETICLWDPLNIFDSLSFSQSFTVYYEPFLNIKGSKNSKSCFILHYRDVFIKNDSSIIDSIFRNNLFLSNLI